MEHNRMLILELNEKDIDNPALLQALKQIDEHAAETNKRLSSMENKLDKVVEAFPGGDFEGHRRYHQTMIELLNERRRLRAAILEKTIGGLVWGGMVLVGISIWHYIISKMNG